MKSIAKVSCLCLALGYGFSYTHAATARVATAQQDNTRVQYTSNRPQERLFVSNAVEEQIKRVKSLLTNARLAWMFENCFPNTLDTTVHFDGDDDTFVYTGDIPVSYTHLLGAIRTHSNSRSRVLRRLLACFSSISIRLVFCSSHEV